MRFLQHKKSQGFTLIEMAIVLVIIGIILAGVMKGRDIVRGAQVKQFSQQFAQKWQTACQTYYDKTGQQLNDGEANGGDTGGVPDGLMDGNTWDNDDAMVDALRSVGITPCTLIKSKLDQDVAIRGGTRDVPCAGGTGDGQNIWATLVEGEYAGGSRITIDLKGLLMTYGSGSSLTRNVIVFYDVPTDVAKGLDTAIDGIVNGQEGSMVCLSDTVGNREGTGTGNVPQDVVTAVVLDPWPDANDAGNGVVHAALVLDF